MHVSLSGRGPEVLLASICCLQAADRVSVSGWTTAPEQPVHEVPPNAWRVLQALGVREALEPSCFFPLADLTRSASSGYLLSQRPLREFARDRYGYAHACIENVALEGTLRALAEERGVEFVSTEDTGAAADLYLTNQPVADAQTTPTTWTRSTYRLQRGDDERDGRFLSRWIANRSCATCLPCNDSYWVEIIAESGEAWHQRLTGSAEPVQSVQLTESPPREHWFRGDQALFGRAAHTSLPFTGLGFALAAEDAWVLMRMLDNYDDHLPTALEEYEQYRRVRARKVHAHEKRIMKRNMTLEPRSAWLRNLKIAFGSRFLPEVMMQKVDDLYGYDCVKGFR